MNNPASKAVSSAAKESESTVIVAVRVRPENKSARKCLSVKPRDENGSASTATATQLSVGNKTFSYDHVFEEDTSQATVYSALVSRLVASCFRGYNGTIFAYGQTGSGKTHSVVGLPMEEEEEGLIPRAIRNVFTHLDRKGPGYGRIDHESAAIAHATGGRTTSAAQTSTSTSLNLLSVHVSFLEIYNDECRDLLHPDIPSREIMIREDRDGRMFFTGAREEVSVSRWLWA